MAHPKRKISKTRRDKRRTHYKAADQQISTCSNWRSTLYHRAHWHEGKLYYRGKVLIDATETETTIINRSALSGLINQKSFLLFILITLKLFYHLNFALKADN